ncbi:MAG: apolipoprotein N-acyltransferase [Phycisphaerales bacterium]
MGNVLVWGKRIRCFELVGLLASGVLLTLIQPPFHLSLLAWVAYVPFILVAVSIEKIWAGVLAAYILGLVYWLGNIYWMSFVTVSGWVAFCAWTALLWPVLIITLRFCKEKKIPLMIAAAVLIVGIERLQGFLLGGFYWRHLSHSQYANITLIQIADIFGAAGLSFLIAMVNGLVAELIVAVKNKSLLRRINFIKVAVVIALLAGTILYGRWRIEQSKTTIKTGPVVGVVQSNLPQSVKSSDEFEVTKEVFAELLGLSRNCSAAGAKLVVWPETIVPVIMDKAVWPFLYEPENNIYFHKALGEHTSEGVYVLVGAPGGEVVYLNEFDVALKKFNSAFLYEPDGDQALVKYNKIHLVPFGEIVPFKQSAPWLYRFLMMFSPYDFDYNLTPGDEYTVFEIEVAENSLNNGYRFGVMICYEGVVPHIARQFINGRGGKGVDWLVNISNDGWFVRFKEGKTLASTELAQHTISCVFRAVENRISVLRSVNTGISCLIDPAGRIKNGYGAGNLPEKALARKAVEGWFTDSVPIDSRVSIFSRFGEWLDTGCEGAVLAVLILLLGRRFVRKKRYTGEQNGRKQKNK